MKTKTQKQTKTEVLATEEVLSEQPDNADRNLMIAEAAYYRAEQRGFSPEQETEDWLEAEKQIEKMVRVA